MSFQIETERLILRDIVEDDIPTLIAQYAEPEAKSSILSSQYDSTYNHNQLQNAIAWAKQPHRQYWKLSVILKRDSVLIGLCSLNNVIPKSNTPANIGWHYGNRYRGNGYATEAARKLLYIGFHLYKVNYIYADCFADNKASIRIMEKIGMKPHLNFFLINIARAISYGESKQTVRYGLSSQEWLRSMRSTTAKV